MKKFFNILFVVLGVVFLIQIIFMVYFYVVDPLNLKPLFMDTAMSEEEEKEMSAARETQDKNPVLNTQQEQALENIGVDPASIPTTVSPEEKACFIEILGQERVDEIVNGAAPSPVELLKVRSCI